MPAPKGLLQSLLPGPKPVPLTLLLRANPSGGIWFCVTLSRAGNLSKSHRGFVELRLCRQGPEEGLLDLAPENLEGTPC